MIEGIFSFLFEFIGELFLTLLFDRSVKPSKKRINRSMEELKKEPWFKVLYEEPNYKKLLDRDESIRHFIGENGARRINKREKLQQNLKKLLREAHLFEPSFIDKSAYKNKFEK